MGWWVGGLSACQSVPMLVQLHSCTRTLPFTHPDKYSGTHVRDLRQTQGTYVDTYHVDAHSALLPLKHARTHAHSCQCSPVHTHTCRHAPAYANAHTHLSTCAHAHVKTHVHTHTRSQAQTQAQALSYRRTLKRVHAPPPPHTHVCRCKSHAWRPQSLHACSCLRSTSASAPTSSRWGSTSPRTGPTMTAVRARFYSECWGRGERGCGCGVNSRHGRARAGRLPRGFSNCRVWCDREHEFVSRRVWSDTVQAFLISFVRHKSGGIPLFWRTLSPSSRHRIGQPPPFAKASLLCLRPSSCIALPSGRLPGAAAAIASAAVAVAVAAMAKVLKLLHATSCCRDSDSAMVVGMQIYALLICLFGGTRFGGCWREASWPTLNHGAQQSHSTHQVASTRDSCHPSHTALHPRDSRHPSHTALAPLYSRQSSCTSLRPLDRCSPHSELRAFPLCSALLIRHLISRG